MSTFSQILTVYFTDSLLYINDLDDDEIYSLEFENIIPNIADYTAIDFIDLKNSGVIKIQELKKEISSKKSFFSKMVRPLLLAIIPDDVSQAEKIHVRTICEELFGAREIFMVNESLCAYNNSLEDDRIVLTESKKNYSITQIKDGGWDKFVYVDKDQIKTKDSFYDFIEENGFDKFENKIVYVPLDEAKISDLQPLGRREIMAMNCVKENNFVYRLKNNLLKKI